MAKKIGAIVSLSIIGILIIATIVLANIKINYSVECANPNSIWILYNSNDANKERAVTNESDANKIVDYIKKASRENALTALFNGSLNKEAKLVLASSTGLTVPTTTGFYVIYSYDNTQTTKDGNNNNVSYNELVYTVNDVEGKTVVKVYVIHGTSPMSYTHYYELEADFSDLYDFLVEKEYNV